MKKGRRKLSDAKKKKLNVTIKMTDFSQLPPVSPNTKTGLALILSIRLPSMFTNVIIILT